MLRIYGKVVECGAELAQALGAYADAGRPFDGRRVYGNYGVDVVMRSEFGLESGEQLRPLPDDTFRRMAQDNVRPKAARLLAILLLPKWLRRALGVAHPTRDTTIDFFFRMIRRAIRDVDGGSRDDYIVALVTANRSPIDTSPDTRRGDDSEQSPKTRDLYLTDDELMSNAYVFLSGAYDTTGTPLSYATYELALNPDIQQRLYDEVMGAPVGDDGHTIPYDTLMEMPFLEAVVSETFRRHGFNYRIDRRADRDYTLGDTGITVKKGQRVQVPIHAMHHMAEYYKDPYVFDPDRFMPDQRHLLQRNAYMPFGAGPRVCIAYRFVIMVIKVALTMVIRQYKFVRSPDTDVPLRIVSNPVLYLADRVVVGVERR
ncbi:unnamed protein product [Oppiella nova]|uniref:Cytochrome P450 n=1 Tax=Oppiella nova TaxID=334625 RepID=A0A7R9MEK5_9ACAR|nr:unnamed protein product [Oppiella nova]CAG2175812.1 unnamed protein product [Oppiella nova]